MVFFMIMLLWLVGSWVLTVIVAWFMHWIYKWYNPTCKGVLPPGSMGLPLIGETFQLLEPGYSLDMIPFMKKRIQRRIIVSADPNFNHYIFQQDGKLFDQWYLDSLANLLGKAGAGINLAHIHKYVRSMALNHFGVNALKEKLLLQMEEMVSVALDNWSCQASIDVKYAFATMALEFGAKQLISYDPQQSSENITDFYFSLLRTLMSFPLNIPGTAYHKCMKNREKALNMIRKVFKQRLALPEKRSPGDFLDTVIRDMKVKDFLTAEFVVHMIFGLLFSMSDTISIMTTLTLKLLDDYPHVLEQLIAEHEAILKKREKLDSSLSWNEYKSMAYTLQVVNEVLRLGNFAPGMFRRTLRDVQVNGYTIPAGWPIMIATPALHLNSEIFNDPLAFNPQRWKDCKSNEMSKNFMPFGEGMKQCAGAEYTRVFIAVFLHVLVTKYRWMKIRGGDIRRDPLIGFGKGLHIKLMEKHH